MQNKLYQFKFALVFSLFRKSDNLQHYELNLIKKQDEKEEEEAKEETRTCQDRVQK